MILSRKEGPTIRIGDDIEVTIQKIERYQVRIGISAPREVPVHREEVYHRIKEEVH